MLSEIIKIRGWINPACGLKMKPFGPIAQFRLERTPDKREVESSSLSGPTTLDAYGGVAQLGERLPCTQEVDGSSPFTSTKRIKIVGCEYTQRQKNLPLGMNTTQKGKVFAL